MQVVTTSKVLVLGKTQINLVFRSLIRTFDLSSKVLALGKTQINLVFRSLIRTFVPMKAVSRSAAGVQKGTRGKSGQHRTLHW